MVTRGGYLVGNGINWKGQVFSKMRNHTATNKMTVSNKIWKCLFFCSLLECKILMHNPQTFLLQGVGNTLKRHYETYLAEYELAHDDVDGECCLLCNRSQT